MPSIKCNTASGKKPCQNQPIIQNRPLHDDSFEYACLLVWLGDNEVYEKFCRELAGRAGQPQDEFAAFIMARVCTLGPCKAVDREKVLEWIEKTGVNEAAAYRLHVLGLAYYRAGKYEQAIQYLEKSNANNWTDPARSMNWLVLAMAYHQLHNVDQSEQSLKTAHDLIALAAQKQPGGPVDLFAPIGLNIRSFPERPMPCCMRHRRIPKRRRPTINRRL